MHVQQRERALMPLGMTDMNVVFMSYPYLIPTLLLFTSSSGWHLSVDMGAEHVFFNASADGCFEWDIIDETLNAFRDADGMVRMVSGNAAISALPLSVARMNRFSRYR